MVLSDSSNGDIGWKKWLIAGWAFMECLFFGGLLYGWGSIVFVLKDEGIYADLCPRTGNTSGSGNITHDVTFVPVKSQNETGNNTGYIVNSTDATLSPGSGAPAGGKDVICKPQDSNYALCFTIGSALFCLGCAVLGHVNYKYGTRVTRILSFLTFVAGTLMMAFISKEHPWLMFPGLSLMGIGGLPILVTNTQVSNLFSTGSSTFVGLLCGGFDMSSAVMLMLAYEGGFSRQYMFLLICGAHLLVLVSTFFFLPREFIPRPKVKVIEREVAENEEVGIKLIDKSANVEVNPPRATRPSLRSCMLKPMFVSHVLWLSILQVRFYYFVGSINQYLNRLFDEDKDEVSKFTNMCFTIMMGGLITSPMAGIVYDLVKKLCKDGKSQPYREVLPAALPLAVGSLLAVLLSVLVLIPSTGLLYLIFVVMTLFRSFLYSMAAAFLSAVFPSEYFGMLYGVMIVCGGVVGFLQFAFFKWSEMYAEGPLHANIFQLVLVTISFIHPLFLWITCSREEKKFKTDLARYLTVNIEI
ncbi:S43A3-like protein [Mya arenaria]|uniref:S43A3-like protein n=1 Tax=Mya arenaria TaxID=6604 RepID=A0ABY7DJK3_MYAAR|nr:S43A3-like protein [Mya arenaria]